MFNKNSGQQPFFTMAQILSLEIIEGSAVHLKHTAVITITCTQGCTQPQKKGADTIPTSFQR